MQTSTGTSYYNKRYAGSVLIVEDNPDQWLIMQSALRNYLPNVQTAWAAGVNGALGYLDECTAEERPLPRLILLDLYLPDREQGWQLLKILKEHPRYHETPVIVVSYSANRDDIRQTYKRGGTSYIVKPTEYPQWLNCFQMFKTYWWDAVTLPKRDI